MSSRAVFLDRDGVLVPDNGLITRPDQLVMSKGVPQALAALKNAGYLLFVVTNQAVVARGLVSMEGLAKINDEMLAMLAARGAPMIDGIYFCPHHPNATLPEFRVVCDCRKPRPGMILKAAADHDVHLSRSFMVGDRISDIAAGTQAGCQTVLVRTGIHDVAHIVSPDPIETDLQPDWTCDSLLEASNWILDHT